MPYLSFPTFMINSLRLSHLIGLAAASLASTSFSATEVDPALPEYQTTGGVSGSLISIGSDTLNNLMTFWAEGFRAKYPNVSIQVEGKGSATAPPALIEGTAQLGPMSREMKQEEIDAFEKKFGYKPTPVRVAVDALAVFAHKDNTLKGLNLAQVDSIFSSTRKLGAPADLSDWGQAGLPAWNGRAISLYGRNSASGTYGFFKEAALGKGDFKASVKEQPGSSAVVQGVSADEFGLGYSGIGYITSGVRALPIAAEGTEYAEPSYENCLDGSYPLARFLYIYINKAPGKPLNATTAEFVKFIISKQGQEIVVKDGYYPLPAELANEVSTSLAN
jgi:phosphate transport system substrate-binding protein